MTCVEQRVPAAGDQAHERRLERLGLGALWLRVIALGTRPAGLGMRGVRRGDDEVGSDMALQMIDRRERQLLPCRERLGRGEPHQQRADQPRTLRSGDQSDVVKVDAGFGERLRDHQVDQLQMMAGGDLGHDAAVAVVHALRGDHVRARVSVRVEDRCAGVVAAALQGQDRPGLAVADAHAGPGLGTSSRCPRSVAGVRHITSASSPLSW